MNHTSFSSVVVPVLPAIGLPTSRITVAVPPGIKLIRVNAHNGMRAGPGDPKVILEAFKPGTAPPDNYSVIGTDQANGTPLNPISPDSAAGAVRPSTGGLY